MQYREYGSTGKKLSVLGFGGMRFPGKLVSTQEGREQCAHLVVQAWKKGINFFDTCHEYCGGHGEEIYGLAFKEMKQDFFVSTKSQLAFDPDADAVRRRIDNSLCVMGLEKIHFFHMWCIRNLEEYRQIMRPGGPYEGACKAKEEGLIEHLCFSTHCTGEEIETILRDDAYEGVILGYNLLNYRYRLRGLEAARKKGLGVAVMNPLAGGVLPANAEYFSAFCESGESITDAAFRFVVTSPGVTCALSGMTSEEEIARNVESIEKIDFSKETARQETAPPMEFNDLCTGCGYCAGCPAGLEISKLMLAYNQAVLQKGELRAVQEALHNWWNYEKTQVYPCRQCGACEKKCTQHLPIMQRIEEINHTVKSQIAKARENLHRLIGGEEKIGLYAIGAMAQLFMDECRNCGVLPKEIFMFDGNDAKWGKEIIAGYAVESPETIASKGLKRLIVCNSAHFDAIYQSLRYLESDGVQIVRYESVL